MSWILLTYWLLDSICLLHYYWEVSLVVQCSMLLLWQWTVIQLPHGNGPNDCTYTGVL